MHSRCRYCITELRCARTIAIGVCSKCENNFKRRVRYGLRNENRQNGISPVEIPTGSRFNLTGRKSNNVQTYSDKQPCSNCDDLSYVLHENNCFRCYSDKKKREMDERFEAIKKLIQTGES